MKKKVIGLFFIIFFLFIDHSFSQFVMEDFLASARNDLALGPSRAKLEFLKDNNFNGPWISRLEFRTRSNDANLSQEDFRFRLTPGNPSELKAYKRYYDKQLNLLNTEYQEELNNALLLRYFLAIDHIFESRDRTNLQHQLEINQRLIDMMNTNAAGYSLDLGNLIDAESDDLDLEDHFQHGFAGFV